MRGSTRHPDRSLSATVIGLNTRFVCQLVTNPVSEKTHPLICIDKQRRLMAGSWGHRDTSIRPFTHPSFLLSTQSSTNQPVNESPWETNHQITNQPTNHALPPTNQPTNPRRLPTYQPTNQSANHMTKQPQLLTNHQPNHLPLPHKPAIHRPAKQVIEQESRQTTHPSICASLDKSLTLVDVQIAV